MSDSDSEYEEIEYLVYADFGNQLTQPLLEHPNAAIKFIGLEGEQPLAEFNGSIFKGTYDTAIGTNVFFEKDNDSVPGDPLFEVTCRQKYKYYGKTNKVLRFQRIFVEKQTGEEDNVNEVKKTEEDSDSADIKPEPQIKLNINYENAIAKFGTTEH